MISSYPLAMRRQLLSKHFLISTMPERALDDLVAEHYRKPQEHDITVPLSQHDLGSMVGAGRERSISSSLCGALPGSSRPGVAPS